MSDISVSRNHAKLKLHNGYFYLEDNGSKFGTVVLIQNDILFHYEKQVTILSGKIYLKFNTERTCLAWIRCYHNKLLEIQDLNDYLQANKIIHKTESLYDCCFVIKFLIILKYNIVK